MSYSDNCLTNGEVIIEKARVTGKFLIGAWIKGILLCFLLLIPTIKAIIKTIRLKNIELALTNKRLIGKVGVVAREAMDTKLDKVQNVKIVESFWGRIFHFCTVVVTTAGQDYNFVGIKDGNKFKATVMNQIEQYEEDKVRAQAEAIAKAVSK